MSQIFNPIPIEYLDVSVLEDNIELIQKEYNDNYENYKNAMNLQEDSITMAEAFLMNSKGELPTNPLKSYRVTEEISPTGTPGYDLSTGYENTWIAYNNEFYPLAEKYFPNTCAALNIIGNVFFAAFASLQPGGKIAVHKGKKRGNMKRTQWCFISPTINPTDCYIGASETLNYNCDADEFFYYTENGSFQFEDTEYWHWVENNTDEERVVLMIDYWENKKDIKKFDNYIYYLTESDDEGGFKSFQENKGNKGIHYESN